MKTLIRSLPVTLLVLLFTYAAASKLLRFEDFRGQLYNQAFPHRLADMLLILLPATELLAAGLLLFPRTQMAGLVLSLNLLLVFSGYITLALLHFWERLPCSCGGVLSNMGWQAHLVFNLFFVLLNLAAIRFHLREPYPGYKRVSG